MSLAARSVALLLASLIFSSAQARPHMLAELEMSNRQCMRDFAGSNESTRASGVTVNGASAYERDLLNRAVAKMHSLAQGGRFKFLQGLRVDFMDYLPRASGCVPAAQTKGFVEIGRRCPPGYPTYKFVGDSGVGLLLHEIGHHVGNRGGYNGYPVGCHITEYCTHTSSGNTHAPGTQRNEEFAEVFAAYVLKPELLRQTEGCTGAYRHMRTLFGGPTPGPTCRAVKPATVVSNATTTSPIPLPRPRPQSAPRPALVVQLDIPLPRPRPQPSMQIQTLHTSIDEQAEPLPPAAEDCAEPEVR